MPDGAGSAERLRRADALFERALDLPAEERRAFVEAECAGDEALLRLVVSLLAQADTAAHALATAGAFAGPLTQGLIPGLPRPGDLVDRYRLLEPLGDGGMGEVWKAEQLEPVQRPVAIKLIKTGLDSREVLRRFEAERQALALMAHPNIAHVYEAGTTAGGRPFIAMEFVHGLPITEHCDRERLGIEERIALFLDVCSGVQHAHHKGVVHRDLKPRNVLVSAHEGRAVPKIIDFGIARALDRRLFAHALVTEIGQLVGTPEYMSPEQADPGSADVDTRSDVFSLGVLLHELLVGARPRDVASARERGLEALVRAIRESEPVRPSAQVRALGERADAFAAARQLDARGLARRLRGDLDWIVLRALERDPSRRYNSPNALAGDLARHLAHEPVVASPPTTIYRLRKFVRRNRGVLAGSAAVFLALVLGLAGTTAGLLRAREEAAVAEAVNRFLNEDLLAAASPTEQGKDVTVREVLDVASAAVDGRFDADPRIEATIRRTIGTTYMRLGELELALPHLERARTLAREALGPDDEITLAATDALGEVYFYRQRTAEAEALFRESLEGRRRVYGEGHELTIAGYGNVGLILLEQGRLAEAEEFLAKAVRHASKALGDDHTVTLSMRHNLGSVLFDLERLDDAARVLGETVEASRRTLGSEHPDTLASLAQLSRVHRAMGRYDLAEPLYRETLEARRRVLGPDHPQTLLSTNNMAVLLADAGRYDEAVAMHREALAGQERVLGRDHDDTVLSLSNIGDALTKLGRHGEALATLEEAERRLVGRESGARPSFVASVLRRKGIVLRALGRADEARATWERGLALATEALGAESEAAREVRALLDEAEAAAP